jgi:acyl-CoA synthetase (AMP-forming)/AMP-acid ligase II
MTKTFPSAETALPDRICDVIRPWAERSPDHPALIEASGTWTYSELAVAVSRAQAWLRERSSRPGDRVMIVGENCREFVAILLATAALDAWPVLVNARLSAREVDLIREHCGARRVLFTHRASPHTAEHAQRCNAAIENIDGLGSVGIGPLNETASPEPLDQSISQRVAALIYTSGTTGVPKGVMLSHRNILFMAAGAAAIRSLTPADRLYGLLPMTHAVGLSVVLLGSLLSGATVYLTPRFDPMTASATLKKEGLTVMLGAPATFTQFIQYAKVRGRDALQFPALRIISCSGAPLDAATKSATEKLFGLTLHHGYGITECSPTIAQTRIESPRTDLSIGPPFPGVEIKLVGPDHNPAPAGEPGELWVRGPNIMKGYYRAPEETAAAINAEGWYNTRDLARLEDGNLFIVGRTKDLIVHRGFNVYPAEVEAVLKTHPSVVHCAVIGRSVDGDEEVIAFVQLAQHAQVTSSDLALYASLHLAAYKRPSEIIVLAEMPLTPTGKILKSELAKRLDPALQSH